jgi:hypothetical protein
MKLPSGQVGKVYLKHINFMFKLRSHPQDVIIYMQILQNLKKSTIQSISD